MREIHFQGRWMVYVCLLWVFMQVKKKGILSLCVTAESPFAAEHLQLAPACCLWWLCALAGLTAPICVSVWHKVNCECQFLKWTLFSAPGIKTLFKEMWISSPPNTIDCKMIHLSLMRQKLICIAPQTKRLIVQKVLAAFSRLTINTR